MVTASVVSKCNTALLDLYMYNYILHFQCLLVITLRIKEHVHLSYREWGLFQCRFYVENINELLFPP